MSLGCSAEVVAIGHSGGWFGLCDLQSDLSKGTMVTIHIKGHYVMTPRTRVIWTMLHLDLQHSWESHWNYPMVGVVCEGVECEGRSGVV